MQRASQESVVVESCSVSPSSIAVGDTIDVSLDIRNTTDQDLSANIEVTQGIFTSLGFAPSTALNPGLNPLTFNNLGPIQDADEELIGYSIIGSNFTTVGPAVCEEITISPNGGDGGGGDGVSTGMLLAGAGALGFVLARNRGLI